jgi:hypothetical protein
MSLLNIPSAIGSAISSLTSHGHKKGGVGGSGNAAMNSITSSTNDGQPTGSAQSLFGTLLDSVEQVAGIQTPTAVSGVNSSATGSNAGTLSPAAITAARSAIQKA